MLFQACQSCINIVQKSEFYCLYSIIILIKYKIMFYSIIIILIIIIFLKYKIMFYLIIIIILIIIILIIIILIIIILIKIIESCFYIILKVKSQWLHDHVCMIST